MSTETDMQNYKKLRERSDNMNSMREVCSVLYPYYNSGNVPGMNESFSYQCAYLTAMLSAELTNYILGPKIFKELEKIPFNDDMTFSKWWHQTRKTNKVAFVQAMISYARWQGDISDTVMFSDFIRDNYINAFRLPLNSFYTEHDDVRMVGDFDGFIGEEKMQRIIESASSDADGIVCDHVDQYMDIKDNLAFVIHPYSGALAGLGVNEFLENVKNECAEENVKLVDVQYNDHSAYAEYAVEFIFKIAPAPLKIYKLTKRE